MYHIFIVIVKFPVTNPNLLCHLLTVTILQVTVVNDCNMILKETFPANKSDET